MEGVCDVTRPLRKQKLWMQHTATHCNTLQHTATHCNTLQHTAHCNTLEHAATHCNTLKHSATHCNTLQHTGTRCNTLQHTATHWMRCIHSLCQKSSHCVRLEWLACEVGVVGVSLVMCLVSLVMCLVSLVSLVSCGREIARGKFFGKRAI